MNFLISNTFFYVATISCCDTIEVDLDTSTHNGHGGTWTSSIFSLKRTQNNDQVSDFVSAHSAEIDLSDLSTDEDNSADVSSIYFF